ncbi:hypothetical protein ACO2I3_14675 [Leptospira interrogans]
MRWWRCGKHPIGSAGKRLKVMIPTLLPALERHGRLTLGKADRALVLKVSAATIDRLLADTKVNDQAFVEQKNGAVVRRLVGYGQLTAPHLSTPKGALQRRGQFSTPVVILAQACSHNSGYP